MQYLLGFVSGILAAGFGAWFTIWLEKQRDLKQDQDIYDAFKEELISNLEMLSANCTELEKELEIVDDQQHFLSSLTPFYLPTWDVLKFRLPKQLADKQTFRKLALTMHLILLVNNEIAAREKFKIDGAALTGFSQTLKKRNELLIRRHIKLLLNILSLKEILGLEIDFHSPSKSLMNAVEKNSD